MKQCQKCKENIDKDSKFCEHCGEKVITETKKVSVHSQKWWYRLATVIYVLLYAVAVILSFSFVDGECSYADQGCQFQAFAASFLFSYIIIRLLKVAFHYVVFSEMPQWKKEFKSIR